MKKLIFLFTLVLSLCSVSKAQQFTVDGIKYNPIDATTVEVVANNYSGSVNIPAEVANGGITYTVTAIGNNAFYDCSSLTSVIIPNSVTEIGLYAFYGCSSLTPITIPNSVTTIKNFAFSGCTNLTSITIPNSVTSIGNNAFKGCIGLTSVTFHCPTIGNWFSGMTSLTSVTIGNTVDTIGENAFARCSGLTSVAISEGVETIGNSAFRDCTALTSITIPNSVTSIGGSAFYGCIGLTSITIPNSVTSIEPGAFEGCSGLNSVTFHCPTIGNWFMGMTSLTSVTIGNTVETIGNRAFSGCIGLTSVTIPESVTTIGVYAFFDCIGLTSVTISEGVETIGNRAFEGCIGLTSITIPNSVTSIGGSAFFGCSGLTSIIIPNSVTSIGGSAFYGCSGLTSVAISEGVETIGNFAFSGCIGLTSVTIPESVTSIGENAFRGCDSLTSVTFHCPTIGNWFRGMTSLTSVTIGNTVDTIGPSAFYGCSGLTSVAISEGVETIENSAFRECIGLTSITIPNSVTSIGNWTTFYGCSGLTSVIFHCPTIGNWFSGMTSLTSVTIGNTVETIEENAFSGCSGLTSVTIPNSVTSIGENAFSGCDSLTSVTFHCPTIGNWFSGMTSLTSVTIGNTVDTIGENAFARCSGLTSVAISEGVETIGNSAFRDCTALTSVAISEGVETIGNSAFEGCIGLTSITIPNSVTSIGNRAFYGCSALEGVILGTGVSSIGNYAFALSSASNEELTIYSRNSTPPATGDNVIEGRSNVQVIVQCGYETAYQDIDGNGTNWLGLSDNNISQDRINLIEDVAWQNGSYSGNGFNIEDVGNGGIFIRRSETISYGCYDLDILNLTVVPRSGTLTSKAGEWAAENAGAWIQTEAENTEWVISNGSTVTFASQPTDGTITVKDGGELVANVELPNVTVEKTTVPNQWNFMGFPIKETNGVEYLSQGIGDIWALGFNYYQSNWDDNYLYWTDESHSLVVQGNGIFVFPEEANTFKIRGTVPVSGSTVSVTNPVSGPVQTGRYMALANPYAEKLDIATFLANANSGTDPLIIQGEVVYRYNEENGNSSYEPLSSGEIEVGEGFFVNMNDGYVTVNIDNSPIAQAKSTPREFLTLSVSTDGYKVPVKFAVNQAASQDYDIYDANKMFGSGTVAEPYLFGNNVMLCKEEVDALPYTAKMNVRTQEACSVEISADRIPEQYTLTLVDGEEEIPMQEGDTYAADLINGENSNRFRLKIGKGAVSIQDIAQAESLNIRANNRFITVSGSDNITTEVYNALGQKVYETKDRSFELNGVAAGAYIVKATDGRATHSTKIIIQ